MWKIIEFEFNPLVPNFNQLKIMVWSDVTEKNDKNLDNNEDNTTGLSYSILPTTLTGDKAVGQIIFPLAFLKSGAFQRNNGLFYNLHLIVLINIMLQEILE